MFAMIGKIKLLLIYFYLISISISKSQAQIIYWQETLSGGSTMAGFTTYLDSVSGNFSINYPFGSIVKKAFFIATKFGSKNLYEDTLDINFLLNNQSFNLNSNNRVTNYFYSCIAGIDTIKNSNIAILDITDFIQTQTNRIIPDWRNIL